MLSGICAFAGAFLGVVVVHYTGIRPLIKKVLEKLDIDILTD